MILHTFRYKKVSQVNHVLSKFFFKIGWDIIINNRSASFLLKSSQVNHFASWSSTTKSGLTPYINNLPYHEFVIVAFMIGNLQEYQSFVCFLCYYNTGHSPSLLQNLQSLLNQRLFSSLRPHQWWSCGHRTWHTNSMQIQMITINNAHK